MKKFKLSALAVFTAIVAAPLIVQADPPTKAEYDTMADQGIIIPKTHAADPRKVGGKAYYEALQKGEITKEGRHIDERVLSALARRKAADKGITLEAASKEVLDSFGLGDSKIDVNLSAFEPDDYTADKMEQSPILETLATKHAAEAKEPMTKARYDVLMDLGILPKTEAGSDPKIGNTMNSQYEVNMEKGRTTDAEQDVKIRTTTPTVHEQKYGN
ncbi:hypothetical protein [Magnetovibrio sp.]|uniref:hypothetical protein n=1 Tax=Magnetovibrio sp. TaxID=2024836 RepID=UPI002F959FB7